MKENKIYPINETILGKGYDHGNSSNFVSEKRISEENNHC